MSKFSLVFAGMAALAVSAVATPQALALAQDSGQRSGAASQTYTVSQKSVNLSPIVVYSHRLYWPVVLQMIKKGLTHSFSTQRKDADKMVCQFEHHRSATGGTTLSCETNRAAWQFERAAQSKRDAAMGGGSGVLDPSPGFIIVHSRINRGALLRLLKKLPPANASYTLRVTDHGQVVAEYVFRHGNLVSIREIKPKQ